ncbi:MAG: hypothetical protein HRT87_11885 [Legionellales bacterium]|nr:hypothetical protein [Legionellales bacterium]
MAVIKTFKMNGYLTQKQEVESFLYGQLELYKIEFSQTNDNNYLEVMNNINKTINIIKRMDSTISKLSKNNIETNNR